MSIMQTVLQSPHFMVIAHVCRRPRVDCGYVQGGEPARFIFTRRGSFAVHVGSRTCFARPGTAVLVRGRVEYRISHPDQDSCDCCTDVWLDDATLDALGLAAAPACREFPHDLRFQKDHVEMMQALRRGDADAATAEEVLLDVLGGLLGDGAAVRPRAVGAALRLARVQEAIIGHAGENLGIEQLAALAGCSPFHLCRLFRSATGQSLRQFRLQQRLGTALGRLAEGEEDLAGLACDLGFASHSHMTEAFRRALGRSPRELREELRRSDLRRLQARLRGRA
ncbi:AraC family transcriptional regulator [Fulvimonas yonginensis]|uniref:AraC family transcriptional regulator n=1 Tax=Fulvimonas yonginensis TaxID=1495200 RepID=A0ABU8J9R1_9GAMM